ncbi:hypothetical protein [Solicola gregarius]|uniref:Uncharacterized protein n=1 Tax=Solicola gregarius TaxID=2908642 RepID=A0AA46TFQ2_9ACTN|nr:hypothetical protein [Solicola gregarius]UYM04325.1 hypothetical protein L0C25_17535 [Solicola gregarius]
MDSGPERLWHVTVTVSGTPHEADVVRDAMSRLGEQHAFLHSMRYAMDRAEIAYWEQAAEMLDAAAMAMRVWNEHRSSAGLPAWEVVGLEVLERETFQTRTPGSTGPPVGLHRPVPTPFP